jgi:hypothetical protein
MTKPGHKIAGRVCRSTEMELPISDHRAVSRQWQNALERRQSGRGFAQLLACAHIAHNFGYSC